MTSDEESPLQPGQRVQHAEFGEGVVVERPANGFARIFFGGGERQVPVSALAPSVGRSEQVVRLAAAGERRARRAWPTCARWLRPTTSPIVAAGQRRPCPSCSAPCGCWHCWSACSVDGALTACAKKRASHNRKHPMTPSAPPAARKVA